MPVPPIVDPEVQPTRTRRSETARRLAEAAGAPLWVIVIKIIAIGLIDAIAITASFALIINQDWLILAFVVIVTVAVNWIYFSKGKLPAKYLTPGLIFLLVFQVFVIGYTAFIGFTNYSTGHNGTKESAISSLLATNQERVADSPAYPLTVVENIGGLGFLITTPDGDQLVGTPEQPMQPATGVETEGDRVVAVNGYTPLTFSEVLERQTEIFDTAVQFSEDPNDGFIRTQDGSTGFLFVSNLAYDAEADTMTDTRTGVVYSDTGNGAFTSESGEEILPGWRVVVGFDNFVRAFSEESIRGPLISVTVWTFVFAFLSVATTFALGLFLAVVFNDMRMRGRKVYRVLLILPYAFPAFLSAFVWAGMLSESFGFVNQVLLGGAEIPWLTDPTLAKISILMVNLWLGFPYMFLVCTGALQSIPEELTEAARVDGAGAWAVMRRIKLPLLMVSVAPLLIASFAFNFNNFNLIYFLTGGGPRDAMAGINVGATDILISMVYKIAFTGQLRDYGLASAFSILIFFLVAAISIISFRRTKALEDLN